MPVHKAALASLWIKNECTWVFVLLHRSLAVQPLLGAFCLPVVPIQLSALVA